MRLRKSVNQQSLFFVIASYLARVNLTILRLNDQLLANFPGKISYWDDLHGRINLLLYLILISSCWLFTRKVLNKKSEKTLKRMAARTGDLAPNQTAVQQLKTQQLPKRMVQHFNRLVYKLLLDHRLTSNRCIQTSAWHPASTSQESKRGKVIFIQRRIFLPITILITEVLITV